MTFPCHSQEQNTLIPVISTLLQFNSKECNEIMSSHSGLANPVRQIKEIKRKNNLFKS